MQTPRGHQASLLVANKIVISRLRFMSKRPSCQRTHHDAQRPQVNGSAELLVAKDDFRRAIWNSGEVAHFMAKKNEFVD